MAYDEGLAQRLRELLQEHADITEKKMFGGLAFLHAGHMFVGIAGDKLMARVGPDQYAAAIKQEHASEMDFTGRPMHGYVFVDPLGLAEDQDLASWVERCLAFVCLLRPKPAR